MDDCGGGYSESIAEMCDELQNGCLPLLVQTPNGRGESGGSRDCFLLNPLSDTVLHLNMFRFLGKCTIFMSHVNLGNIILLRNSIPAIDYMKVDTYLDLL